MGTRMFARLHALVKLTRMSCDLPRGNANRRFTTVNAAKSSKKASSLTTACPICLSAASATHHFHHSEFMKRDFFRCIACSCTFVPKEQFLSPSEERKHYSYHTNDSSDLKYRKYLQQVVDPLVAVLRKGDMGLDFGCGPGPTIFCDDVWVGFLRGKLRSHLFPNTD